MSAECTARCCALKQVHRKHTHTHTHTHTRARACARASSRKHNGRRQGDARSPQVAGTLVAVVHVDVKVCAVAKGRANVAAVVQGGPPAVAALLPSCQVTVCFTCRSSGAVAVFVGPEVDLPWPPCSRTSIGCTINVKDCWQLQCARPCASTLQLVARRRRGLKQMRRRDATRQLQQAPSRAKAPCRSNECQRCPLRSANGLHATANSGEYHLHHMQDINVGAGGRPRTWCSPFLPAHLMQ